MSDTGATVGPDGVSSYADTTFRGFDRYSAPRTLLSGIGQYLDEAVIDGSSQGGFYPGQQLYPKGGDIVTRQSVRGQLTTALGSALYLLETYRKSDGTVAALVASAAGSLYIWGKGNTLGSALSYPSGVTTINAAAAMTWRIGTTVYIVDGNNPLMRLDIDAGTLSTITSVAAPTTATTAVLDNRFIDLLNASTPSAANEAASWSTDLLTTPSSAANFPPSPLWSSAFNGTFYDAWTTNSQGPDGNTLSVGSGNYPNDHSVYAGFNFFGNDLEFNHPGSGRGSMPGGGNFTDYAVWACMDRVGKGFTLTNPFPNQRYTTETGVNNCSRVIVGLLYYTTDTSSKQGVTITATAYTGGVVASINISSGGSGYGSPPTVTFTAPPNDANGTPTGRRATGTAVLTAGAVTSITITDPGFYPAGVAPTISFGSGTAAATCTLSALTASASKTALVLFPYVSNAQAGTPVYQAFDFADTFPPGNTSQVTGWTYTIFAGPNNTPGQSPYITGVSMWLAPGDWSFQSVSGGGLTLIHNEPASGLFGKIAGTRAIKDYGANQTAYNGYNTVLLPLSGANVTTYIANGFSFRLGFRQSGSNQTYYSNLVTFAADGSYAAIDVSTVPVTILASFRYLEIQFAADITFATGMTSFTIGSVKTAGNLSVGFADYSWLTRLINGTPFTDTEVGSDASPASTTLTPTTLQAVGDVIPAAIPSADAGVGFVTYLQIWRAGGTFSDGYYRLVATIKLDGSDVAYGADTITYGAGIGNPNIAWKHGTSGASGHDGGLLTDNTPDGFLELAPRFDFGRAAPPSAPETVCEFAGRLCLTVGSRIYLSWLLNSSTAAGLYYTLENFSTAIDPFAEKKGAFFDLGLSGDNDPIMRPWLHGTELICFKANSIYRVSGQDATNFTAVQYKGANANVGLLARNAVALYEDALWFLALDGLYLWTGVEVQLGPLAIQNDLNPKIAGASAIAPAAYGLCHFLVADQRLILIVPRPPSMTSTPDTVPTVALVLDRRTNAWTRWTFGAVMGASSTLGLFSGMTGAAVFGSTADTSDLVFGTQNGQMALMSGYGGDKLTPASSAVPVAMLWTSKQYGQQTSDMGFFTVDIPLTLVWDVQVQENCNATFTVTGDVAAAADSWTYALVPGPPFQNPQTVSAGAQGRNVTVSISVASLTQSRIKGYLLRTVQGRARN